MTAVLKRLSISRAKVEELFGVDLRSLAAFRMATAAMILIDLLLRSRELGAYFTDDGILPRVARIELFESHDPFRFSDTWSLHMLNGQLWAQALMIGLAAVAAVGMLVGYRTRLAALASWILLVSLDARNPLILNSGDVILRCMLFWSLFLPLGARFSLDAVRHGPANLPRRRVLSAASLALLLQLAMMYFFSALFKNHPAWLSEGSAVHFAVHCDAYMTSWGVKLQALDPSTLRLLTWSTFTLELLGPLAVFCPWRTGTVRLLMIGAFWMFHLGLALTMTIGLFPPICMIAWLVFLPSQFWEMLGRRFATSSLARRADQLTVALRTVLGLQHNVVPASSAEGRMPRTRRDFLPLRGLAWVTGVKTLVVNGLLLALLVYAVLWNIRELNFKYWEPILLSRQYNTVARVLGLDQDWAMFSPVPRTADGWLVMRGVLRDGSEVNLWEPGQPLPWEKPQLVSASYHTQRWRKYLDNLTTDAHAAHRMYFANWLQKRWNDEQSAGDAQREAVEVQLIHRLEITPPPGQPIPEPESRILWTWYYE